MHINERVRATFSAEVSQLPNTGDIQYIIIVVWPGIRPEQSW